MTVDCRTLPQFKELYRTSTQLIYTLLPDTFCFKASALNLNFTVFTTREFRRETISKRFSLLNWENPTERELVFLIAVTQILYHSEFGDYKNVLKVYRLANELKALFMGRFDRWVISEVQYIELYSTTTPTTYKLTTLMKKRGTYRKQDPEYA